MEKAICRRLSFLDNEIIKKNKEIEELTSKVLILENKISEMNRTNRNIEEVQEKLKHMRRNLTSWAALVSNSLFGLSLLRLYQILLLK